jgi:hypothetical protein
LPGGGIKYIGIVSYCRTFVFLNVTIFLFHLQVGSDNSDISTDEGLI